MKKVCLVLSLLAISVTNSYADIGDDNEKSTNVTGQKRKREDSDRTHYLAPADKRGKLNDNTPKSNAMTLEQILLSDDNNYRCYVQNKENTSSINTQRISSNTDTQKPLSIRYNNNSASINVRRNLYRPKSPSIRNNNSSSLVNMQDTLSNLYAPKSPSIRNSNNSFSVNALHIPHIPSNTDIQKPPSRGVSNTQPTQMKRACVSDLTWDKKCEIRNITYTCLHVVDEAKEATEEELKIWGSQKKRHKTWKNRGKEIKKIKLRGESVDLYYAKIFSREKAYEVRRLNRVLKKEKKAQLDVVPRIYSFKSKKWLPLL